ncbi:MAG TPA: FecR domain-containing protein, partial [Polyangiaceae bacterium]
MSKRRSRISLSVVAGAKRHDVSTPLATMTPPCDEPTDLGALNSLTKLARDTIQCPSAAELDRSLDLLSARAARPTSRRARVTRWSLAGLSALLCSLLAVQVASLGPGRVREPPALDYRVEGGSVLAGGYLRDAGNGGVRLFFNEGTKVALMPGARGRVRSADTAGTRMVLDQGRASFDVARSKERRWLVEAGPFSVAVQGTLFTAAWDPKNERFELRLEHGRVAVRGPIAGGDIELRAGQRLLVDLPKQETLITDEQAAGATTLIQAHATSSSSALSAALRRGGARFD